jgi:LuxR family maltose regulon positive regulatory protein
MLAHLNRVAPLAERLRRHHDSIRIQLLRALALKRSGEDGRPLFMEANSLAEAYGLARVVADTHPELADWGPARRARQCRILRWRPPQCDRRHRGWPPAPC